MFINLVDGEYGSDTQYSSLYLRSFTGSGTIILRGNSTDYSKVILHHHIELNFGVSYQLRDLTVQPVILANNQTNFGVVFITKGQLNCYNSCFDISLVENSTNGSSRYIFQVANYGHLRVYASNNSDLKSGIYIKANPEQLYKCNIIQANSGKVEFTADITMLSSLNNEGTFIHISQLSTVSFGRSVFPDPGRSCLINVPEGLTITGRRYYVIHNSICNVSGRGQEFFPGDIDGVLATGGQYS